jgi:hypothetical protein
MEMELSASCSLTPFPVTPFPALAGEEISENAGEGAIG